MVGLRLRLTRSDALPVSVGDALRLSFHDDRRNLIAMWSIMTDQFLTAVFVSAYENLLPLIKTMAIINFCNIASWNGDGIHRVVASTGELYILVIVHSATCVAQRVPIESTRGARTISFLEDSDSAHLSRVIRPKHRS